MTSQPFRLPTGGRIDRSRRLAFTFNGQRYEGHPGDSLASALLANGVHLVGRSFKYHRPRGIMSAGIEETNALVRVGSGARIDPAQRATQIELYAGLAAESINCWPSLAFDLGSTIDRLGRFLPAGFYYKTFLWPGGRWMFYERFIRKAAGLGEAPREKDPDRYEKRFDHCDVLVVGGGPAGLAAAYAAGRAGARVVLADDQMEFGGQLLWREVRIDGGPALSWVTRAISEMEGMPDVRLLPHATVCGYYDHNFLTILERVTDHLSPAAAGGRMPRQRLWKLRAREVVLATGAIERPLVFDNNDLPGIMLAGAVQCYLLRYGARPGARAVIFTNNDSAYETAAALFDAKVPLAAIVDTRAEPVAAAAKLRQRGLNVLFGHAVVAAKGRKHLSAVTVAPLDEGGGGLAGPTREIACDLLCVSGGWSPAVHLFSQSGGRLEFDPVLGAFLPGAARQAMRSAGAAAGAFDLAACLAGGAAAGATAAQRCGFGDGQVRRAPGAAPTAAAPPRPLWEVPSPRSARRNRKFVDLQNDVTAADIALAAREGYTSVELAKRYTTAGMGLDQGKTGNINALAILASETAVAIPAVGTTTFRPPYVPMTFGALAGRDVDDLYEPVRKTPLTDWHAAAGAAFEPVGRWRRPMYYPRPGEDMAKAVERECRAVRDGVALCDASTLGKIDIQGPDAVKLLDRVYTNAWGSLAIGACRYGLMLREDGMVFDDGVTARLAEHHYLMTTTTGHADAVLSWLEEWRQCEWADLRVYLTAVTTHWAAIMLTGPKARAVLARVGTDIDIDRAAFRHMAVRQGTVAGLPARIFRVSFTGELTFEINVPASCALALWRILMIAGGDGEITPIGTEALHVLRAEKGYIAVGHDTDGTVTPADLGMGWIVSNAKADFIGKRSQSLADLARSDRRQFVGLLTDNPQEVLPEGAQIIEAPTGSSYGRPPVPMIGHVTSSYLSPTLDRSIALALIAGGHRRMGEVVAAALPGRAARAKIVSPRFYDPDGARLND
ncbi:MAG: sarcosine oxidase subunit alpha family protein [Proteobacteria bacterium]|nr:sarcosine oxidase subunit alpha family protein [Pseudomonadota bacterium]